VEDWWCDRAHNHTRSGEQTRERERERGDEREAAREEQRQSLCATTRRRPLVRLAASSSSFDTGGEYEAQRLRPAGSSRSSYGGEFSLVCLLSLFVALLPPLLARRPLLLLLLLLLLEQSPAPPSAQPNPYDCVLLLSIYGSLSISFVVVYWGVGAELLSRCFVACSRSSGTRAHALLCRWVAALSLGLSWLPCCCLRCRCQRR